MTVILEYIDHFQFLLPGSVQPSLAWPDPVLCRVLLIKDDNTLRKTGSGHVRLVYSHGPILDYIDPKTRLQDLNLLVYLCDHTCQLEYNKQYLLQVHCYFSSLSTSIHEANLLEVVIKNNIRSSARALLFILHTL